MTRKTFKFDIPNFRCEVKQMKDGSDVTCTGNMPIWCPPESIKKFETPLGSIETEIDRKNDECVLKGMSVKSKIIGSKEIAGGFISFTRSLGL